MEKQISFFNCLISLILLSSFISFSSTFAQQENEYGLQDSDGDGIPDEKDACPNNSNWISPCIEQEALDAQNQAASSQGQVSIMECVVSSGACTADNLLLNDNYEVVCDPSYSDCSSFLSSTAETISQDASQASPAVSSSPSGSSEQNRQVSDSPDITFCIPSRDVCSPTDVLLDDQSNLLCDPKVSDCSAYLTSQSKVSEIFCNPNQNVCNPTDVLINEIGDPICDPKVEDCSRFITSDSNVESSSEKVCRPENTDTGVGSKEQVNNVCANDPQSSGGTSQPDLCGDDIDNDGDGAADLLDPDGCITDNGENPCVIDVWVAAFLPPYDERGKLQVPPSPPPFSTDYFEVSTDNRNVPMKGGSARLWSYLAVDLCTPQAENKIVTKIHGIGMTHGWMHSYGGIDDDEDPVVDESLPGPIVEEIARASAEDMSENVQVIPRSQYVGDEDRGDMVIVTAIGDATIPLIPSAPAINYEFTIYLTPYFQGNPLSLYAVNWNLKGAHDGFPAYEVFIGKTNAYFHTPKESEGQSAVNPFNSGQTLSSLFPPMEIDVAQSGVISTEDFDNGFIPPKPTEQGQPINRVKVYETNDEKMIP